MKLVKLSIGLLLSLGLTGCAYETNQRPPSAPPKTDNLVMDTNALSMYPYNIQVYTLNSLPSGHYHIVGEVSANCYNNYGIKRQRAAVNQVLRQEASELNGDAVIILNPNSPTNLAEVIEFDDDLEIVECEKTN